MKTHILIKIKAMFFFLKNKSCVLNNDLSVFNTQIEEWLLAKQDVHFHRSIGSINLKVQEMWKCFRAHLLKHVVEQTNTVTWLHTVPNTHSKEVTKYLVTSLLQKLWPQSPGMSSTFHWLPPFSVRSQNSSCSGKEIHSIQLLAAAWCSFHH